MIRNAIEFFRFVGIAQALLALVLFPAVVALVRRPAKPAVKTWTIISRGRRYAAIRHTTEVPNYWVGYVFAVFLFYLFPLWWWLLGLREFIWRFLTVMVVGMAANWLVVLPIAYFLDIRGDFGVLTGIVCVAISRVYFGLALSRDYSKVRIDVLAQRGWVDRGIINAPSRASAIKTFTVEREAPTRSGGHAE